MCYRLDRSLTSTHPKGVFFKISSHFHSAFLLRSDAIKCVLNSVLANFFECWWRRYGSEIDRDPFRGRSGSPLNKFVGRTAAR